MGHKFGVETRSIGVVGTPSNFVLFCDTLVTHWGFETYHTRRLGTDIPLQNRPKIRKIGKTPRRRYFFIIFINDDLIILLIILGPI